jgi:hypothetical protein
MHATFWKPASSNLFAAAADLDKEGKIKSSNYISRQQQKFKL